MFPWYSHTIPEYRGNIMGISMSILLAGSLSQLDVFLLTVYMNQMTGCFFFNEIFYGTIMGQWG